MPLTSPSRRFGFHRPTEVPSLAPRSSRPASLRPVPIETAPRKTPLPSFETNMPDELSELACKLKNDLSLISFRNVCIQRRGRCELEHMSAQEHPAAALINHLRVNGAPINLEVENNPAQLQAQLEFGCHSSARHEAAFFCTELADQIRARHNLVLPWSAVKDIKHLWLTPPAVIPQPERRPRPIYNFTRSGVNDMATRLAPSEAIQFGAAGYRLLHQIVHADPAGGTVFMAKTDLSDAYMRVWIRLEDVAKLAFVVPPLPGDTEPLIGFHLSLPIGYVESAPFFCIVTETIADLVNENEQRFTHPHPLEALAQQRLQHPIMNALFRQQRCCE